MKGLKKIALVAAIAAVPVVANAQLKALNDSTLGNVTGQAGVTIELQTQVSIGSINYTDTDTGGGIAITGVQMGGAGLVAGDNTAAGTLASDLGFTAAANSALDDAALLIDINAAGDATIDLGSISGGPIDWGMKVASIDTTANGGSTATTLLSNVEGFGQLAALNITVESPATSGITTGSLNIQSLFSVDSMQFDAPVVAVGVKGLSVHAGGYLQAVAAAVAGGATTDVQIAADAGVQAKEFAASDLNLYASTPTANGTNPIVGSTAGGGITVYDPTANSGAGGFVQVAQSATSALAIDVTVAPMDINMQEVDVGGASIGSVAIQNLAVTNTKLKIYGH